MSLVFLGLPVALWLTVMGVKYGVLTPATFGGNAPSRLTILIIIASAVLLIYSIAVFLHPEDFS